MALIKGALSILKSQMLTSIHGRKLGIDHNGFVVGHPGARLPLENSTAASTLANYGISVLSGSTATFTLNAPPSIGAEKTIINGSSVSTAAMAIVRSSSDSGVTFNSTGDGVRINLLQAGAAVRLVAISTSKWAPLSIGSSTYMNISTSS